MRFDLMRMAWLPTLLAVLVAQGCSRKPSGGNAVYFGPTAVYRLQPDTREVAPDAASTKIYQDMFNFHPSYNQPLHRIVRGGPQTVYLGMVLPPLPPRLEELAAADSIWTPIAARRAGKGGLMALLKDRAGMYDVRYLGASEKSKQTHVINLVTTDSTLARSYYDAEPLFKGNLLL